MIWNPIVTTVIAIIGVLLTVITLLFISYQQGKKTGKNTNGYVTQSICNREMTELEKNVAESKKALFTKVDTAITGIAKIEGFIESLKST